MSGDNLRVGQGAVAESKLRDVETAEDFLLLCELDQWARERAEHPTLAERSEGRRGLCLSRTVRPTR